MQDLHSFVSAFTTQEIPAILRRRTYFAPGKEPVADVALAYMTTRLGEQRRNYFRPSFPLLDWISQHTDKRAVLTDEAAWLFICGKTALKEGIVSCSVESGPVIVLNQRNEVLGWGERGGIGITNKLDRGDYLRRGP